MEHTSGLRAGTPPKPYHSLDTLPNGLRAGTPPRPYRPLDANDIGQSSSSPAHQADLAHDIVREAAARELANKIQTQSEMLLALGGRPAAELRPEHPSMYSPQPSAGRSMSPSPLPQGRQDNWRASQPSSHWGEQQQEAEIARQMFIERAGSIDRAGSPTVVRGGAQSTRRSMSPTAQALRRDLLNPSANKSVPPPQPSATSGAQALRRELLADASKGVSPAAASTSNQVVGAPSDKLEALQTQLLEEKALCATLITQAQEERQKNNQVQIELREVKESMPKQLEQAVDAMRAQLGDQLAECSEKLRIEQTKRSAAEMSLEEMRQQHEAALKQLSSEHAEMLGVERVARQAAEEELQILVRELAAERTVTVQHSKRAADKQPAAKAHSVDMTHQMLRRTSQPTAEELFVAQKPRSRTGSEDTARTIDTDEHAGANNVRCGKCCCALGAELLAPIFGRFVCDVCDQELPAGSGFRSCQGCDYDVCAGCVRSNQQLTHISRKQRIGNIFDEMDEEIHAASVLDEHIQCAFSGLEHPGATSMRQSGHSIPVVQPRCGMSFGLPLGGLVSAYSSPQCTPRSMSPRAY